MPDISKINGVAVANIAKINGRTKTAGDGIFNIVFPSAGGGSPSTVNSMQYAFGKMRYTTDENATIGANAPQYAFGKMRSTLTE